MLWRRDNAAGRAKFLAYRDARRMKFAFLGSPTLQSAQEREQLLLFLQRQPDAQDKVERPP
jgi:hypothetical protein